MRAAPEIQKHLFGTLGLTHANARRFASSWLRVGWPTIVDCYGIEATKESIRLDSVAARCSELS
jgi:hypothetical protein